MSDQVKHDLSPNFLPRDSNPDTQMLGQELTVDSVTLRDISTRLGHKEAAVRDCLYQSLRNAVVGTDTDVKLHVLDIGCGRGELLKDLKLMGHDPVGLDVEPACVEISRQYAEAMQGGFDDLPRLFAADSFDVVVSSHVLEHVDDPLGCLKLARALGAKRYIFAVPNVHRTIRLIRAVASSNRPDHPTHVYGWGRPEFNALLVRAGFQLTRWHCDRVTLNPVPGRLGSWITRCLSPLETSILPKLLPGLSSSLIAECRPQTI